MIHVSCIGLDHPRGTPPERLTANIIDTTKRESECKNLVNLIKKANQMVVMPLDNQPAAAPVLKTTEDIDQKRPRAASSIENDSISDTIKFSPKKGRVRSHTLASSSGEELANSQKSLAVNSILIADTTPPPISSTFAYFRRIDSEAKHQRKLLYAINSRYLLERGRLGGEYNRVVQDGVKSTDVKARKGIDQSKDRRTWL